MSTPTIPSPREPVDTTNAAHPRRVRVAGDLFHGRVPADAVYVGRHAPGLTASRYANPHKVGACRTCGATHDQAGAAAVYVSYLDDHPELVAAARVELAGRDLACWCRLEWPCHVDVLLGRVNRDQTATYRAVSLRGVEELDGACPSCAAVYGIDESGRAPQHRVPPSIGTPTCPGSGERAVDVHVRPYWFVEGVRYL